jgi:hypothetical protein
MPDREPSRQSCARLSLAGLRYFVRGLAPDAVSSLFVPQHRHCDATGEVRIGGGGDLMQQTCAVDGVGHGAGPFSEGSSILYGQNGHPSTPCHTNGLAIYH